MKNTGIIYSSTERTPVVLPEMAELLPPLSEEQLGALETDLLKNGCYTSIIVNEDLVVIDGHNRKSLCDKHGLPYSRTAGPQVEKGWLRWTQRHSMSRSPQNWTQGASSCTSQPKG